MIYCNYQLFETMIFPPMSLQGVWRGKLPLILRTYKIQQHCWGWEWHHVSNDLRISGRRYSGGTGHDRWVAFPEKDRDHWVTYPHKKETLRFFNLNPWFCFVTRTQTLIMLWGSCILWNMSFASDGRFCRPLMWASLPKCWLKPCEDLSKNRAMAPSHEIGNGIWGVTHGEGRKQWTRLATRGAVPRNKIWCRSELQNLKEKTCSLFSTVLEGDNDEDYWKFIVTSKNAQGDL